MGNDSKRYRVERPYTENALGNLSHDFLFSIRGKRWPPPNGSKSPRPRRTGLDQRLGCLASGRNDDGLARRGGGTGCAAAARQVSYIPPRAQPQFEFANCAAAAVIVPADDP
jgi:hypothetical protein